MGKNTVIEFPPPDQADILVVDDLELNLTMLSGILATRGYRVRTADSGEEALRIIDNKIPDLVILDMMMPDMDGLEVCERLKTSSRTADVPVIFVSALNEVSHKMDAFDAGGADYITRPYEPVEVLARVESQVRLREFQTRLEQKVRERTASLHDANLALEQQVSERTRAEVELKTAHQQMRDIASQLINAREQEKALIAREIHDELGSTFTALSFGLSWIGRQLPEESSPVCTKITGRIAELRQQVAQAADVARRIQTELRPTILDELELIEALQWQASQFSKRTGIPCIFSAPNEAIDCLSEEQNSALYRILQEALTNIGRHSGAGEASVTIVCDDQQFLLRIEDNGKGLPQNAQNKPGSYGLKGMLERAWAISGELRLESPESGGTRIEVQLTKEQ